MQAIQYFKGLGVALFGPLNGLGLGDCLVPPLFSVRQIVFLAALGEMRHKSPTLYCLECLRDARGNLRPLSYPKPANRTRGGPDTAFSCFQSPSFATPRQPR